MKKALIFLALLLPVAAFSQSVTETLDEGFEARGRVSVGANWKVFKGFHLYVDEQARFDNNFKSFDRLHTTVGLSYKFNPYLKASAEYTLITQLKSDNSWRIRNRFSASLTGSYKTGPWNFSLKETFRLTNSPYHINTYERPRNAMVLKHKLTVGYKISKKLEPYAFFEIRNTLNEVQASITPVSSKSYLYKFENLGYNQVYINRYRAGLGLDWKISKHHALDFKIFGDYYYDKDIDVNSAGQIKMLDDDETQDLPVITYTHGFLLTPSISYKFKF